MGAVDHGTQTLTYEYFEEATAEDFNKRHLNIRPRGIYSGGYLTRVSDTSVTLSSFVAEIGDDNEQIGIQTASSASLTSGTLDSGTIDIATPILILRWAFAAAAGNYVEVHAIASVAVAQANDLIIGKCNFTGSTLVDFDYTNRTFLSVQDLFFKVETSSGLNVQLRAGRIHSGSASIFVPEQVVGPFSVPGSPNSRIDLLYIANDGTPTILQGTAAVSGSQVAPNYGNRLVVAEITVVNGDSSIAADKIKDARNFISSVGGNAAQAQQVSASLEQLAPAAIADLSDMSIVMSTNGGIVMMDFTTSVASEDGRTATLYLYVDGVVKVTEQTKQDNTGQSYDSDICHMHHVETALVAGSHTFKVRWVTSGGTIYMNRGGGSDRVLSVVELPS